MKKYNFHIIFYGSLLKGAILYTLPFAAAFGRNDRPFPASIVILPVVFRCCSGSTSGCRSHLPCPVPARRPDAPAQAEGRPPTVPQPRRPARPVSAAPRQGRRTPCEASPTAPSWPAGARRRSGVVWRRISQRAFCSAGR